MTIEVCPGMGLLMVKSVVEIKTASKNKKCILLLRLHNLFCRCRNSLILSLG